MLISAIMPTRGRQAYAIDAVSCFRCQTYPDKELIILDDADNPSFAVIPSLTGALQRQSTQRTQAVALKAPLGVSMRDVAGQGLTRYANVNYAQ